MSAAMTGSTTASRWPMPYLSPFRRRSSARISRGYFMRPAVWMPFAERRTSGLGIGGIGHTMADMNQDKMIVLKAYG